MPIWVPAFRMELAMHHVLLVEPDDDFCLSLRTELVHVGCRLTIVGTFAEAIAAVRGVDDIDNIITDAALPDGSGLVLAQDFRKLGKPVFVLRERRGRTVVYDRDGTAFLGDRMAVGQFLAAVLLAQPEPAPTRRNNPNDAKSRARRARRVPRLQ
jgi:CheY-like chemotaxis protein